MSIRILPDSEIADSAKSFQHPPLLFANPKHLYQRRAARLRQLAENNSLGGYLKFAAELVDIQLRLLEQHPIEDMSDVLAQRLAQNPTQKVLNAKQFVRTAQWRELLGLFIAECKKGELSNAEMTIDWLERASSAEIEMTADDLLNERFEKVGADTAIFLWSVLSLYWVQLAQQLPRNVKVDYGEHRHTCPVCDSAPVASMVHFGDTQGLRYLHCALCESEWNMVRAKCSNCEQTGQLDYWSLDHLDSAVKAESCGDCGSYLKIMYQEKDPHVEAAADDLASLFLDLEMEQKGLFRSGINPFLFKMD